MAKLQPISSLRGVTVRDRSGADVGEIKDFILDPESANVRYAVVAFGGFLGVGEHQFAVPFSRLLLDTENECFVADVDETELEEARDLGEHLPEAKRKVYRFQGIDALRRGLP